MSDTLINVEHLSKKFCRSLKRSLWYGVQDVCGELLGRGTEDRLALRNSEFLSLDDVSFQLRRGESLGLIGRNGAGKSTLLKIINGLIKPDAGRVEINGRVGALIELGAGFNPILTGRENIYVNAAILGFSKRETDRRLEAIIDFAELDEFIDAPLRSYSSGMYVRLGFAVATQMEPDILLVDEVLAVGDMSFRMKCYRRLSHLLKNGTSVILVSHSSQTLLATCQSGLYLKKGVAQPRQSINDALRQYEHDLETPGDGHASGVLQRPDHDTGTGLSIQSVYFRDADGDRISAAVAGQSASLCLQCQADIPIDNVNAGLMAYVDGCQEAVITFSAAQDRQYLALPAGTFELRITLPVVCLRPGNYTAKLSITQRPFFTLDVVEAFRFRVDSELAMGASQFFQPHEWSIVPSDDDQRLTDSVVVNSQSSRGGH